MWWWLRIVLQLLPIFLTGRNEAYGELFTTTSNGESLNNLELKTSPIEKFFTASALAHPDNFELQGESLVLLRPLHGCGSEFYTCSCMHFMFLPATKTSKICSKKRITI